MTFDVKAYNKHSWNKRVDDEDRWTVPATVEDIEAARQGQWSVLLTENKPVPRVWFPEMKDCRVLCLASGGGQQGPILAAAGAKVTVFDYSPRQLDQDRFVAERDSLAISTVEGDMVDLSAFSDESFDVVFHPVSNLFVPDVRPVWREAFRVLSTGGILLAGFVNPCIYLFDHDLLEEGIYQLKYAIPYSDVSSVSESRRQSFIDRGWSLEFGHSLSDQIGGQLRAGFMLTDMYEDYQTELKLAQYMPSYVATRAMKP